MKIAYVVPYVPNLIRTRPYNLICNLAALGHEVSVFTLGSGAQDLQDVAILQPRVSGVYYHGQSFLQSLWNSLMALPSRRPLQTVYSWNRNLAEDLEKVLKETDGFDVVHVEHLRGSLYGQYIRSRLGNVPIVWDSVDCISYLFKQAADNNKTGFGGWITRFELGRTRYMEGRLVGEFDHVLVTSETDKNALIELAEPNSRPAPVSVLSNGVDLEYFHPAHDIRRDEATLVFTGKMSYHANVSMVKYLINVVMPLIWREHPEVRLFIVGKDPPSDILAMDVNPRITVTGTVEDVRPFLWQATVSVVPLVYGAGIQNKVLEAMACGTPVVTTSKVLESLNATSGRDLLTGDDAVGFSNCVLRLLDDRNLRGDLGANGMNFVRKFHDWKSIAKQLLVYYEQTIEMVEGRPPTL